MAVKIRLRQQGRANRPFYRVVLTESKNRRDGRYIETLGWYNPFETEEEKHVSVSSDRVEYWLGQGAIMSEKVEALIAKAAPGVVKALKEQELAKKAKRKNKRKARKAAKR